MKKAITLLAIIISLSAAAQKKDTLVVDSATYIKEIQVDLSEARKAVYGKVTQEQFDLIQQYNALVLQMAMQRKKKKK